MFEKFNIGQGNPAQWKPQRPDTTKLPMVRAVGKECTQTGNY